MSGGEANDRSHLLRVNTTDLSAESDGDLEAQRGSAGSEMAGASGSPGLRDLFRQLDRGLSGRRHSFKRIDRNRDREVRDGYETRERPDHHDAPFDLDGDVLGESAPPEWALLLIGCLLGLATGLFVAAFNNGVCAFLFSARWLPSFSDTGLLDQSSICYPCRWQHIHGILLMY
ncbi:hypothetical protein MLD38_034309 [Melastoma candidum]|uniref:Uncharacterized protein n=1 Tax=Melastoma candidum TaxID=119954 RepID=A0ACB9MA27_9MYRT|nr:hypothetical protein MLD38_034309 [Melastoma candidum]